MKRFSTLIACIVLFASLYGQTDTAYIYTYGGIQNDVCNQIKPTYDGGYIMIGTSNSFGCGNTDFYAIKIDSSGNHEWSRSYGGTENEEGFSVAPTLDHGYAFVGFTDSYGAGGYDVFLVKTDSAGNFQWQKTYGGTDWDFGYSIQQLSDSGFIISGLTYSYGPGNGSVYVIRTDKNGDTLWTKAIGGQGYYSVANSVCVHEDSLYYIAGSNTLFGNEDTNVFIMELNNRGTLKWDTTYHCTHNNSVNSIRGTLDNGFILFGSTDSIQIIASNEMMIKLDSTGKMQWMRIYYTAGDTSNNIGYDAIQAPDGTYLAVSASCAGYGLGPESMRIWHSSLAGWPLSGPSFGGTGYQWGNSIALARNGNAVFIGASNSFGYTEGLYDVYLVRVNNDSIVQNYTLSTIHNYKDTCICTLSINPLPSYYPEVKIFPNPISSFATLLVQGTVGEHYFYSLYNGIGQCVIQETPIHPTAHGQFVAQIEKGNLAAGAYVYEILNQSGITVANGKIIIE